MCFLVEELRWLLVAVIAYFFCMITLVDICMNATLMSASHCNAALIIEVKYFPGTPTKKVFSQADCDKKKTDIIPFVRPLRLVIPRRLAFERSASQTVLCNRLKSKPHFFTCPSMSLGTNQTPWIGGGFEYYTLLGMRSVLWWVLINKLP